MGRRQSNTSTYHFRKRGLKDSRKGQAYKVSAHDHWFYIDLADHKSKTLLEALNNLFYFVLKNLVLRARLLYSQLAFEKS